MAFFTPNQVARAFQAASKILCLKIKFHFYVMLCKGFFRQRLTGLWRLDASTINEGLNFYDSQHRFEHSQLLLVLLISLPHAPKTFQCRVLQDLLILACSHAVSIYTLVPGDRLDPGEKLVIGCRKATISAETQHKGETEAVNGCKVGSIEATIERHREVSPEVWISRAFEVDNGLNDNSEFTIENEDETDQAKHYMESNENYYLMFHSVKELLADEMCLGKTVQEPEVSDILFTWIDLQAKLNTELLNNLGNFINRVLSFIAKDPVIQEVVEVQDTIPSFWMLHLLSNTLGDKIGAYVEQYEETQL
ncbi:hypothetical protein Lser_V15G03855 [Lactuca serriola]